MKKIDSLNLIPFIDIVLVLLVIVLTTATFIKQNHLSIDVPQVKDSAKSSSNLSKEDKIISIKNDNKIFFDEREVSLEQLRFHISHLPKDTPLVLNGDKKSNFEAFVKIMAMLENLEFKNLYILIDAESTKSTADSAK
ncbi:biopolymer transporter ExbD [Helicobacter sp. 23-1045]